MPQKSSQLELFEDNDSEIEQLKREIASLRKRCEHLRRGITSKHNQLAKLCLLMQDENTRLKGRIESLENESISSDPLDDDYLRKLFEEAYLSSTRNK